MNSCSGTSAGPGTGCAAPAPQLMDHECIRELWLQEENSVPKQGKCSLFAVLFSCQADVTSRTSLQTQILLSS